MSVTRADQSVQELRQLIQQLEASGMADHRPEVRALLGRSRALLRRSRPAPLRVAGKLGALLLLAVDGVLLGAAPFLLLQGPHAAALLLPLWLAFRLRHQAHWLGEGCRFVQYHIAWAGDWFAEAFSHTAMARLEMRILAAEVMGGWRQHRRSLPRRAGLADVARYLEEAYGPQAAGEFHRRVEAVRQARGWTLRGGTLRNRPAERLAALRWSALMGIFACLAERGALWADFEPEPEAIMAEPAVPEPAPEAEPPERAAQRADLREQIRRKRQDITTAFGWKLKTAAEIAERDAYLTQTRAKIAALEKQLAALET